MLYLFAVEPPCMRVRLALFQLASLKLAHLQALTLRAGAHGYSTAFRMSASAVNADGTLKKFATPVPSTPACIAACNGETSVLSSLSLKELLETDTSGNTPLIWSADRGQLSALELILSAVEREEPSAVNAQGYIGNTAIARAARGGHVECVVALLSKSSQINPNIHNDKRQYPLHFAAFKRHPAVVKALLASHLCDSLVTDRKGRTPAEDTSDEAIRNMILESRRR